MVSSQNTHDNDNDNDNDNTSQHIANTTSTSASTSTSTSTTYRFDIGRNLHTVAERAQVHESARILVQRHGVLQDLEAKKMR